MKKFSARFIYRMSGMKESAAGLANPAQQHIISSLKKDHSALYLQLNINLLANFTGEANRMFNAKPATANAMGIARNNFSESIKLARYMYSECDPHSLNDQQKSVLSDALSSYAVFLRSIGKLEDLMEAHEYLKQALVLNPNNEQAEEYKSELEYNYRFER